MDSEPKWRCFEKLVAKVQQELAPQAIVTHNDQIKGHESDTLRQIDVTVKQKIGQYDVLIAIDCKDYKRAVNVNEVEQFIRLIQDIRANKGVMVAANGFTDTAKRIGEKAGLNLYRLVDTDPRDWQTYVSIPVLCDFRGVRKYQFSIPESVATFLPLTEPNKIIVSGSEYPQPVSIVDLLQIRWNSGELPHEPGEYRDIPLTKVITGFTKDKVFEADVLVHIVVERKLFFGELTLTQVRGFKDQHSGQLLTREFTTDWLDAGEVERNWRRLESLDEIAVKLVFTLTALDYYSIPRNI